MYTVWAMALMTVAGNPHYAILFERCLTVDPILIRDCIPFPLLCGCECCTASRHKDSIGNGRPYDANAKRLDFIVLVHVVLL